MAARTLILSVMMFSAHVFAVLPYNFSVWNNCTSQCYGDADCQSTMNRRVTTQDLAILSGIYPFPVTYPNVGYDPRVDFDRNFSINDGDVIRMEEWINQFGCPNDCAKKLALRSLPSNILAGSTLTVKWDWNIFTDYVPLPPYQDQPGLIALYYQINGGAWTFIGSINGARQLDWLVPNVSGQYRLKVVDQDHPGLEDIYGSINVMACPLDGIDANGDCAITLIDFSALSASWQLETDGKTLDDLILLAEHWLESYVFIL